MIVLTLMLPCNTLNSSNHLSSTRKKLDFDDDAVDEYIEKCPNPYAKKKKHLMSPNDASKDTKSDVAKEGADR